MRHLPLPAPTRRTLLAGGALAAGLMMAPRIAAAQAAANLTRVDALIEYADASGRWITERADGHDRPETEVEG